MLHDPAAEDVLRDDIAATLQRLVASGKLAAVGVAGDLAAARNGASRPELFTALQFANNPFEANAQSDFVAAWREAGKLVITHSALGAYGALPTLTRLLSGNAEARQILATAGYAGEAGALAAQFLTDYALATNAGGIALFSAAKPRHLDALVAHAAALRPTDQMLALAAKLFSLSQDRP
jgi:aryl-alcohol dehydrogenase-like predicted oxidoreductase